MFSKIGNLIKIIGVLIIVFEMSALLFSLFKKGENEFEDLFGNSTDFEYTAISRNF